MKTTIIEILLLGTMFLTRYKIRKVHLASFKIEASLRNIDAESSQTYRQLKVYLALVELLEPRQPLLFLRGWAASPDFLLIPTCSHSRAMPDRVRSYFKHEHVRYAA